MSIFYPMEVSIKFKSDHVCKDHEKFFFILHQGTLDESFLWEDDKIIVKHHPTKIEFSIVNDSRSFINNTKLFLFLYDGLNSILSKNLGNQFYINGDYEVIRTNNNIDFDINYQSSLIYLPQTNQIIIYQNNIDRKIFLTHAYVVIIPISQYLK